MSTSSSSATPGFNVSVLGVKETIELLLEWVIPWKRQQAERREKLENAKRQSEIYKLNAETLEKRAQADRELANKTLDVAQARLTWAQAEKTLADAELVRAQARKEIAIAERTEKELRLETIKLALSIVEKYGSNLRPEEKLDYAMKLLPRIEIIANSPLELG